MDLVNKFLNSLRLALSTDELGELNTACGATKEDIATLRSEYPNCPESLICLLENVMAHIGGNMEITKLRFVF